MNHEREVGRRRRPVDVGWPRVKALLSESSKISLAGSVVSGRVQAYRSAAEETRHTEVPVFV